MYDLKKKKKDFQCYKIQIASKLLIIQIMLNGLVSLLANRWEGYMAFQHRVISWAAEIYNFLLVNLR